MNPAIFLRSALCCQLEIVPIDDAVSHRRIGRISGSLLVVEECGCKGYILDIATASTAAGCVFFLLFLRLHDGDLLSLLLF